MSPLFKIINPEHTSQFKVVRNLTQIGSMIFLIKETIPVTLYDNILTCRNTDKKFQLEGCLLNMTGKNNQIIDLANSSKKNLLFESAKNVLSWKSSR